MSYDRFINRGRADSSEGGSWGCGGIEQRRKRTRGHNNSVLIEGGGERAVGGGGREYKQDRLK